MVSKEGDKLIKGKINYKMLFAIVIVFIILVISALIISLTSLNKAHKTEINKIIMERGGIVISSDKVNPQVSPFKNEIGRQNAVYKVIYSINGKSHIAWYRAVKVVNNIHDQSPGSFEGGYGEKWMFDDNH
jgi:hypothetical protein